MGVRRHGRLAVILRGFFSGGAERVAHIAGDDIRILVVTFRALQRLLKRLTQGQR